MYKGEEVMNTTLEMLLKSQKMKLSSGKTIKVHSGIKPEQGDFLQDIIKKIKPVTSLEVGLGFGISALFILDEMIEHGGKKLITMDPSQNDSHNDKYIETHGDLFHNGGLENIRKAGYTKYIEFYNEPSQLVLPTLVKKNEEIQFAFIDGWHTFDHALVDFFFIDQLLSVGGVIVFHDLYYDSIKMLSQFILTNRKYSVFGYLPKNETLNFESMEVLAIQKNFDDDRNYDHFVRFKFPNNDTKVQKIIGIITSLIHEFKNEKV